MPVKFAASKKNQWDEFLDMCVFAYNMSRHESTCFTPFELMFGRKATLAIDIEMRKNAADDCLKKMWVSCHHVRWNKWQLNTYNGSTRQKQTSR